MIYLSLPTIQYILSQFESELSKYSIITRFVSSLEKLLIVEDSLVLYVGILKNEAPLPSNSKILFDLKQGETKYIESPESSADYYKLHIEELTYNELGFKHNHTRFIDYIEFKTGIKFLNLAIKYKRFKGYKYNRPVVERIGSIVPEVKLKERYMAWEGLRYNFIVMEFESASGSAEYAVACTLSNPHSYIISRSRKWIKKGFPWIGDDNTYESIRGRNQGACKAFNSWSGTRQFRLENNFKYYSVTKNFREKIDAKNHAGKILNAIYEGKIHIEEWSTYKRPDNKWKSELLVYKIVKKMFKGHKVLYHHRPFFLRSDLGGQMSYDVFVCGLNIAIEYQGRQHFEPVKFFGGLEGFERTVQRDKLKQRLSLENGIRLILIDYRDKITARLISDKINKGL